MNYYNMGKTPVPSYGAGVFVHFKVELYLFIHASIHIHLNSYKNMDCKKIILITAITI